jgi:hypothetical protein
MTFDWLEITMTIILYLFVGLCMARNRYRAIDDETDPERTMFAVLMGIFWPATIVFLLVRFAGYYVLMGIAFVVQHENK